MQQSEPEIVLWKDSEWSVIDGELCRVNRFSPLGSIVDEDGQVNAMNKTTPYASITFECSKLGKNITGYITHKEDFQHLWAAFEERTVKEDEEVTIIWTKKHYKRGIKLFARVMPKLWVMIKPKGAYDIMVNPNDGTIHSYQEWVTIAGWKPDVME